LSSPTVSQYVAAPPSTLEGFRRYIRWARRERRNERHASFALIPIGQAEPVGVIQMWPIKVDFQTVEWGFVVDPKYWGSELFVRSARLLFAYAFGEVGAHRLEARVCTDNKRGQAAMHKLGARQEMLLRRCFKCNDEVYRDHMMWSILADDWEAAKRSSGGAN
jgi:RimJ/RimL family protein N-acetyltransferase